MNNYWMVMKISFKNQLAYIGSFLFRNLFFIVIIFIFFSLWKVIYNEKQLIEGISLAQTIWYLTIAETITLATSAIWRQIQEEVKDGTLAYGLLRPYSYPVFQLFQGMGESLLKLGPFLLAGIGIAWLTVGQLPGYFRSIGPSMLLIILGQLSLLQAYLFIGLMAFWMEEVAPLYWIWQKMLFIFGGTFLPLNFFPQWIKRIIMHLPFAYGIYWPSITVVQFSWHRWLSVLGGQVFWNLFLFSAIQLLYHQARKRVQVQGG